MHEPPLWSFLWFLFSAMRESNGGLHARVMSWTVGFGHLFKRVERILKMFVAYMFIGRGRWAGGGCRFGALGFRIEHAGRLEWGRGFGGLRFLHAITTCMHHMHPPDASTRCMHRACTTCMQHAIPCATPHATCRERFFGSGKDSLQVLSHGPRVQATPLL